MNSTAVSDQNKTYPAPLPLTAERQARLGLLTDAVQQTFAATAPSLLAIEQRIKSCLISEARPLTEISEYLLALGGKRVRPLMVTLAAKLFGMDAPSQALIDAAAGIELIHTATLLHDDIIDQSPTRRSKTSAFHKYGLTDTLLTGDFLLVRAYGLCAKLDRFVIESTEQACVELTEGEVLEGKLGPDRTVRLDEYINIISKKTASLFRLSAGVGAHVAGALPQDVAAMQLFGLHSGIAFQMIDDILDVVADADLLGKPSGTDLRQKTPSLVNILWLETGSATARKYFNEQPSSSSNSDVSEIVNCLRSSAVIEQAREHARQYAGSAQRALLSVCGATDEQTKQQLLAILDYTLERCL